MTRPVLLIAAFLVCTDLVNACACYPHSTVLQDYEEADLVIIARVVSLADATEPKSWPGGDIASATMIVEKVYKGDVRIGDKLTFRQGVAVLSCIWAFYRSSIGEQYLLYLYQPENPSDLFAVSTCNRSNHLSNAKDDLLYLDKIDQVRGRTRVSGVLNVEGDDDSSLEGRKIRIVGKNKTYIATTDKDGNYEIYDLPPGRYVVEPEVKFGWRVDDFSLTRKLTRSEFMGTSKPRNRVAFMLRPKSHFGVDVRLKLSNYVSGTVRDSKLKPMRWVCVSLEPADDERNPACNSLTDARGRFRINSVEAGTYVLILNYENKRTPEMPFPKLYYRDTTERANATPITVKHGQSVPNLDFVIRREN